MFQEFKEKLTAELSNGLPGNTALSVMMPIARDERMVLPSFKAAPKKSAVLVLFYPDSFGQVKFPLIQRPTYIGAHSAQVSFPGGKSEETDRDLIHTALRETEEEIGIEASQVEVVGQLSDLFISVSNFIVTPFIGFMGKKQNFRPDPLEVEKVIEADLYDIINPDKRKNGSVLVRKKYNIQTPYFDIDNRVVWGATAMILNELSMIIEKTGIF